MLELQEKTETAVCDQKTAETSIKNTVTYIEDIRSRLNALAKAESVISNPEAQISTTTRLLPDPKGAAHNSRTFFDLEVLNPIRLVTMHGENFKQKKVPGLSNDFCTQLRMLTSEESLAAYVADAQKAVKGGSASEDIVAKVADSYYYNVVDKKGLTDHFENKDRLAALEKELGESVLKEFNRLRPRRVPPIK